MNGYKVKDPCTYCNNRYGYGYDPDGICPVCERNYKKEAEREKRRCIYCKSRTICGFHDKLITLMNYFQFRHRIGKNYGYSTPKLAAIEDMFAQECERYEYDNDTE